METLFQAGNALFQPGDFGVRGQVQALSQVVPELTFETLAKRLDSGPQLPADALCLTLQRPPCLFHAAFDHSEAPTGKFFEVFPDLSTLGAELPAQPGGTLFRCPSRRLDLLARLFEELFGAPWYEVTDFVELRAQAIRQ
jgi:hypothetical protein